MDLVKHVKQVLNRLNCLTGLGYDSIIKRIKID